MHENDLRDRLAGRLEILEPGLRLVATNHPLPNAHGTRGFVDILARDRHGATVVIELKRSNSTAREALHEVAKYVELLNREQGIPASSLRAMIVSTQWNELLAPFSRLVATWSHSLHGVRLTLSEDATRIVHAEPVKPIAGRAGAGLDPRASPVLLPLPRRAGRRLDRAAPTRR
jgi:Endonuclease NucS